MNGNKSDYVPIVDLPADSRMDKLSKAFYDEFQVKPTFIVRVPGRVNIIGEHIDYCGYPVLPMALEQDILVAAHCIEDGKLYVRNKSAKYKSMELKITSYDDIKIEPDNNGKPFWYNYVLCGIKGALEHLKNKINVGLQLLIDGNIPPASGLSSSSALVSAACLTFLHAQGAKLSKTEIASLCAKSERYIGTQGGGMDQAIAFLAEKYCAQYITFHPLKAVSVALPEDATFVVAHSLAEANKAATNDFNRRVIECRLAAKIIATSLNVSNDHTIITLSQLQNMLKEDLKKMVLYVFYYLPNDLYTKKDICQLLKITEDELNNIYLTPNTRHLTEFKLKQRALHVYEEAMRVDDFRKMCIEQTNGKSTANGQNGHVEEDVIGKLGELMSRSHASLKELYECSHENLDSLVDISQKMNVHARVTGAGWGGCIVALCHKDKVNDYIEALKEEYYVKKCNKDKNKTDAYVFATSPNYGAAIYKI
ncbi:N-acetylgalactosamine kinase [Aricia agestis]|uniref:N-acetylgalactosamine kinase n=1 Tax=Aricia agestis TaxID=91739 RepID=UPI001C20A354|nr:N-acetylgalactosamine kinase [Aricia agestis]